MNRSTNARARFAARLLGGTALSAAVALSASPAFAAAAAPAAADVEELVVTGTSIRGVAPVGANVISVTRQDIQDTGAQTVQQLLASVPQVTGFNNQAQGGFGSADGSGTNAPTIHSLGASASNQTLVLIDGHRLPLSGLNHTLADPSVIPPAALERVEVLPEGSSAVYGSDAVAGVLNFITRRRYDGLETSGQVGVGDEYHTANFNMVWGSVWDTGSALFAYGYSYQSSYQNGDRDWYQTDLRAQGGNNYNNFSCTPAAVQSGASGGSTFFLAPYTGAGIVNTNTQGGLGPCNYGADDDAVPEVVRHSVLGKFQQDLTDRLSAQVDIVYSQRQQKEQGGAGNITNVVVFGPGSTPGGGAGQINPFFRGPPGVTTERVNFSFDELLPPQVTKAGAETKFVTIGFEYEMGRDWVAELGGTFGQDDSYQRQLGILCSSCAVFALNGTNQNGGSTTANSQVPVLGTNIVATRLPLTTANALDVWSETGANRTSGAVLENLRENRFQLSRQNIENVKFVIGGPAFELPAGPIRVSAGAEGIRYSLRQFNTQSANLGNTAQNARFTNLDYSRDVYAFFAETVIPIIGPDNGGGFIERLDLSGAVRYDHYSDFGSTTNPKFAATMDLVGGLSFRGAWGTSFVAPALTSRGNERGITGESSVNTLGQQTLPTSVAGARTLPGCATAGATCNIGGNNQTQGIQVNGGNASLGPQEGQSWSIGFDWRPEFFRGFELHLTYWDVFAEGLITAPNFSQVVSSPALAAQALIINPTQAQIANAIAGLPQNAVLPTDIRVIYSFQQRNVSNLKAGGIDFDMRYRTATDFGDLVFGLAVSEKVKFDQQLGAGTPYLGRLNTAGLNTTFSSLRRTGRGSINWSAGPWRAGTAINYTGPYWLRSTNAVGNFGARGQRIKSFTTVDANLSYEFDSDAGLTSGLELYLNARNLFNQGPPFADQNGGFSTADATGLGRVITFGLRKEW